MGFSLRLPLLLRVRERGVDAEEVGVNALRCAKSGELVVVRLTDDTAVQIRELSRQLDELNAEKESAVNNDEYEKAAELRDIINDIKSKM